MDYDKLVSNLKELIQQWEATAMLYKASGHKDIIEYARGYKECISELKEILNGDLSSIEKW